MAMHPNTHRHQDTSHEDVQRAALGTQRPGQTNACFHKLYCVFAFIVALVTVSGCTTNPVTGRSQLMIVSEESAISQSSVAYSSLIGGLAKTGKLSTDTGRIARVKTITDRLITQAVTYKPESKGWLWNVNVIDDPETINAFCMPGGKMAVYSGLLDKVEPTDDELAQIMGHEIAHALSSHTAEKMSVQLASQLAVVTATAIAEPQHQQTVHDVSAIAALTLVSLPNSRTAEAEADRIGIELAAKAGYDPHSATTLWEKMANITGSKSRFDFLSTHPSSPKRIEALAGLEHEMAPIYEAGKANQNVPPESWATISSNIPTASNNRPHTATFPSKGSLIPQRLREINSLRNDGVITEHDFQKKKKELLDEF